MNRPSYLPSPNILALIVAVLTLGLATIRGFRQPQIGIMTGREVIVTNRYSYPIRLFRNENGHVNWDGETLAAGETRVRQIGQHTWPLAFTVSHNDVLLSQTDDLTVWNTRTLPQTLYVSIGPGGILTGDESLLRNVTTTAEFDRLLDFCTLPAVIVFVVYLLWVQGFLPRTSPYIFPERKTFIESVPAPLLRRYLALLTLSAGVAFGTYAFYPVLLSDAVSPGSAFLNALLLSILWLYLNLQWMLLRDKTGRIVF